MLTDDSKALRLAAGEGWAVGGWHGNKVGDDLGGSLLVPPIVPSAVPQVNRTRLAQNRLKSAVKPVDHNRSIFLIQASKTIVIHLRLRPQTAPVFQDLFELYP